jgi:hypothetical protein
VPVVALEEIGAGIIGGVFDCARATLAENITTTERANMKPMNFRQITRHSSSTLERRFQTNRSLTCPAENIEQQAIGAIDNRNDGQATRAAEIIAIRPALRNFFAPLSGCAM